MDEIADRAGLRHRDDRRPARERLERGQQPLDRALARSKLGALAPDQRGHHRHPRLGRGKVRLARTDPLDHRGALALGTALRVALGIRILLELRSARLRRR